MSLKEILTSIPAEKVEQLVVLLKKRESLVKDLTDVDEQIEKMAAEKSAASTGGARRKPLTEIPDLLSKTPAGLTLKEIREALGMKYAQVYLVLKKLSENKKVSLDEKTGKYTMKGSSEKSKK